MFTIDIGGLEIGISITIVLLAFICELINSLLGGGHGTLMTPLLILLGYAPLSIVPAVLLAEIVSGFLVSVAHHKYGNVNFRMDSNHLNVALVLGVCSVIGVVIAVVTAINISTYILEMYIGILLTAVGMIMIMSMKIKSTFSWKKVLALGIFASFNKGISGGGYGPIITVGQLLTGFNSKESVSISSLAKSITCVVGFIAYILLYRNIDTVLLPSLVMGSIFSVPISVFVVKRLHEKKLRLLIGAVTIILGSSTLIRLLLF